MPFMLLYILKLVTQEKHIRVDFPPYCTWGLEIPRCREEEKWMKTRYLKCSTKYSKVTNWDLTHTSMTDNTIGRRTEQEEVTKYIKKECTQENMQGKQSQDVGKKEDVSYRKNLIKLIDTEYNHSTTDHKDKCQQSECSTQDVANCTALCSFSMTVLDLHPVVVKLNIILALFIANPQQLKVYLVTAPKALRVGASETVVIQAYGYTDQFFISIILRSYPDRAKTFSKGRVALNAENGFQSSVKLTILPKDLPKKKDEKQYVYLQALSTDFTQEEIVPVSYQNGLLFIQTDKPVYTPDQSVKIRIYSLNEELKPAKRPVAITFKDPEGVKVDYIEHEDVTGIISVPDFKIPSNPKYGLWKIEALYKNDFTTSASTQFEIKEYVLPTFQISIKPEKHYISFKEFETFTITITASYFYKKTVASAYVFVRFGILEKGGKKQIMPHAARTIMMLNGVTTVDFNAKAATETIQRDSIEDLNGDFLYIGVTIQDSSAEISEDAEYTGVRFTVSPFTINLVATPLFIKPKLPYYIIAQVKDILGYPVGNATVMFSATAVFEGGERNELIAEGLDGRKRTRRDDGTVMFVINTPAAIQELEFEIKTALEDELPISKLYTAKAYQSLSESYLYITWTATFQKFRVGNYLSVTLVASSPYLNKIRHFHYQVVSKGKIISFGTKDRPLGNQIFNLNIPITAEMIPSARLIAYYVITGENSAELVVDSVWFEVEEKCVNNQQILLSADSDVYKPGDQMSLRINAQPSSLVALSSIDTAVYEIRTGSKISIKKVLLDAEKHDLGCGAGGGRNNADVFKRAGLMFLTNANAKALPVTDTKCDVILRPKRDVNMMTEIRKKIARFTNPIEQKCCMDGMRDYPLRHSCTERASRIKLPDPCTSIFLECCNHAQKLRLKSVNELTLGRMELNNEFEMETPQIRSYFPESWLWEVHEISERSGTRTVLNTLPDSLTTWEVQGVGISETGICVADPIKVTVYQDVILKAKVPYSVVRGEQVQLRVSVYNYQKDTTGICVQMSTEEGTCLFKGSQTSTEGRQNTACQRKTLEGFSALPFTFTIVPLKIGVHNINFTLKTQTSANEITVHKLRVVPEGVKKEKNFPYILDPANTLGRMVRRIEIPLRTPLNILPNIKPKNVLTVQGDIIGEAMSIALNPEGVHKLTNLPSGSAESELMNVAPIYFIYNYLEKTNSWNVMGPNNFKIQLEMKKKMRAGLTSIMSFRTRNVYSYSMWKDREASTWLTAFVLRVFAQISEYLTLDEQSMCNTMNWLISNCQNSDGSFREHSNYVPLRLQGALKDEAKERVVYLTAFTSIAIQKAFYTCETEGISNAILKADEYLSNNVENVKSTLVLAITAYALALKDERSRYSYRALEKLKYEAFVIGNPPLHRYWKDISKRTASSDEVTARIVETTSYALLTVLRSTDKRYANPVVKWLTEQQRYGGGFLSTQDTVTALEGLTEYVINMKHTKLDMSITVAYKRLGNIQQFELNEQKAFSRPVEIEKNDNVIVRTTGRTGTAIVNMRSVYYAIGTSNETCDFSLTIEATQTVSDRSPAGVETVYHLEACAKYNPRSEESVLESEHSVMEITLNTGLIPEEDDLKILLNGVDGLITDYRISDNSVVLQMDSIPSDNFFCVGFHVYEALKVGMVTPAPFTVYSYHSPDRRCTIFYNPIGDNKLLKLCSGDECKCMKAECSEMQPPLDITLLAHDKYKVACSKRPVYAYKVKILSSEEQVNFIKYNASILEIYMKVDEVEENTIVTLIKKDTCSDVTLTKNQAYLIMGKASLRFGSSRRFVYEYPLDSSSWIELWPSEKECSGDACGVFLQQMTDFSIDLLLNGC
ncbi:LOW QUALITY PROTEIN: complement C5 [Heptranchias perlo]|uniref:LOW QUALITY PROTEIN: complement C5 n=1 Tax=Heptranchias perlo TaxID=212740 RepID=UPI00355A01A5